MRDKFTPPKPLNTAVLFLIFNRLDVTKQVFQAIRQAKPPRLYLAADGARKNTEGEAEKVIAVREYVLQNVDWDCEVKTLFRDKNLGCKYAVSGAIDWFFEQEEMGVILEDDCLPNQSFFWFCEELLERYKDDLRVGQVSGFNYNLQYASLKYDYFFSRYPMIWGWASWRNRWDKYTVTLEGFDEIKGNNQFSLMFDKAENRKRWGDFYKVKKNLIDTWDFQWAFTLYKNNQLTIIPKNNFIMNLGFGKDSTHTKGRNPYEGGSTVEISKIKSHPDYMVQVLELYLHINKNNRPVRRFINVF
jgi:hypothetical protein